MAVTPLTAAALNGGSANSTSSNSSSGAAASQPNFMNLLVAQLKNQDPTNPVSASELTSQLAQLSTVNGMQQMNSTLTSLLLLQGLSQGVNLIGKNVQFVPTGGSQVSTGKVTSIAVGNGGIQLMIGGQAVGLNQVQNIQN